MRMIGKTDEESSTPKSLLEDGNESASGADDGLDVSAGAASVSATSAESATSTDAASSAESAKSDASATSAESATSDASATMVESATSAAYATTSDSQSHSGDSEKDAELKCKVTPEGYAEPKSKAISANGNLPEEEESSEDAIREVEAVILSEDESAEDGSRDSLPPSVTGQIDFSREELNEVMS